MVTEFETVRYHLSNLNDLFSSFTSKNNLFKTKENCMKSRLTDYVVQKMNLP